MKAYLLVYQMGMHLCQRKPEEVEAELSDYMHLIRIVLFSPHRNRRFILNMDQTPGYFLRSRKRTLDVVEKNNPYLHVDK